MELLPVHFIKALLNILFFIFYSGVIEDASYGNFLVFSVLFSKCLSPRHLRECKCMCQIKSDVQVSVMVFTETEIRKNNSKAGALDTKIRHHHKTLLLQKK